MIYISICGTKHKQSSVLEILPDLYFVITSNANQSFKCFEAILNENVKHAP